MIKILERLMIYSEENKERIRFLEWRFQDHVADSQIVREYARLHFEATEPSYQDRLSVIGEDDIKKYTLAEVESARFMTDRQFNDLRASKVYN